MALYKHAQFLATSDSNLFDQTHPPGAQTPYSGIYRCEVCGREDCCNFGNPLPPQNHHQHLRGEGPIRWRMVVAHRAERQ